MVTQIPFIALFSAESGAGTVATLETDKSKTDTPTITLVADCVPFKLGILKEIEYRIIPTAAETYAYMVFEAALAANMASNARMLYESAALRASGVDYKIYLEQPFYLSTSKTFFVATDWTGAPGDSYGKLRLAGVAFV